LSRSPSGGGGASFPKVCIKSRRKPLASTENIFLFFTHHLIVKNNIIFCTAWMEEFEGWLQANEARYPRLTFAVSGTRYQTLDPFFNLNHSIVNRSSGAELGGRGGIATEDILPGEELCSIPVRLVLTTEIARKSEVGRLVAAHLNAVQGECQRLSCVSCRVPCAVSCVLMLGGLSSAGERLRVSAGRAILCAYLIHQRAAQDAFWGPYLRSLPSTFSTPLYWYSQRTHTNTNITHDTRHTTHTHDTTHEASRADYKEHDDRPDEDIQHLAGTNLFYAMQEKQQQIRESFDLLFPALCHAHPTVFPPDLFTWSVPCQCYLLLLLLLLLLFIHLFIYLCIINN
jgi:hypothetical protein